MPRGPWRVRFGTLVSWEGGTQQIMTCRCCTAWAHSGCSSHLLARVDDRWCGQQASRQSGALAGHLGPLGPDEQESGLARGGSPAYQRGP
ncbi:hypothetical protein NDU88_003274 [Pleurodeles waltl]|uniref:Uncharacterized protein n=1 Tax=Pleurodeles waltl TaxID=8319 RepID=A0AAV7KXQ4_PLEWA|nr:hypothetical protein NDU88_003274 [Pleurodeles waltl]